MLSINPTSGVDLDNAGDFLRRCGGGGGGRLECLDHWPQQAPGRGREGHCLDHVWSRRLVPLYPGDVEACLVRVSPSAACSVVLFTCVVHLWCSLVLLSCVVQLWCSVVLLSCVVQLCCPVVLFSCVVQVCCSVVVFTCGVHLWCSLVSWRSRGLPQKP
jgi:hypothetical protein